MDQVRSSIWTRPDGFTPEGLAHVDHIPLPLDLSVAADTTYGDTGLVFGGADTWGIGPDRGRVQVAWWLLAQGLMGPLEVVGVHEAFKG